MHRLSPTVCNVLFKLTAMHRQLSGDLADDVSVNVEVADLSFLGLYSYSFIYQDDTQTFMQTVRGAHVYIP